PTTKRREDARREGMVALSKEVTAAAMLGTFALFFMLAGRLSLDNLQRVWRVGFENLMLPDLSGKQVFQVVLAYLIPMAPFIGGLFAVLLVVGLAATVFQVGINVNPLGFKFDRMNPLTGLQRIFSTNGLVELLKSLFKMGVIGYVTYVTLAQEIASVVSITKLSVPGIIQFCFNLLGTLLVRCTIAMVILAVLDYLYQRWSFEQRIKMTKQEMREELKQTEGDPQLRARVRQVQREMSRARMMENVPKADVVVTNPTHFAVALMYDREVMASPRVVAKGADFIAERIKAVAKENKVPLVENQTVARELYAQVEIGQEVPEQFFRAVAEILAFVYRLKGKTATAS
ncbi:MAG TPA: flagellar biosynthesis protein FlhB, partial [bacterium]